MKQVFIIIFSIILVFTLTSCSQEEVLNYPVINLEYKNLNKESIPITDGDVISMDNSGLLPVYLSSTYSYKIQSTMEAPKLPKVEVKNPEISYKLYLDGELIEELDSIDDEYTEKQFYIKTGFFKTYASISGHMSKGFSLKERGLYKIEIEINLRIDDVLHQNKTELEFTVD